MATLLKPGERKLAETHYFVPEKTPAPKTLGRKTPDCPGETFWIGGTDGPPTLVHRYKPGANTLAALRHASRSAAQSMRKRGVRSALFVFPREAAPLAPALLAQLALSDYDFDRYRGSERLPKIALAVRFEKGEIPPGDIGRAQVLAEMAEWARDLGNTPANDLGSRELTAIVAAAARKDGL